MSEHSFKQTFALSYVSYFVAVCQNLVLLPKMTFWYSELDSFGSSTVPGHLRINILVFSRMSKFTYLLIIQSFSQIY